MPTEMTEIERAPWGQFPGVGALAAVPLQDGRFSVRLDSGRFECFLKRKDSPYLFVLLNGARDPQTQPLPKFERWSWSSRFPGSILCISDPTLYLGNEQLRIGWYVGTDQKNWQLRLVGLVRTIAQKLNIPTSKIICYGSSAGGFASLMLASHLKDATAIAINPQTNVLSYSKRSVQDFLNTCFSGRLQTDLLPPELARMSAITAFRRAPAAKCLIVQNIEDKPHYERHFKPFCTSLRIPIEGGSDKTGRAMSLIYSHPNGHGREPAELVDSLISSGIDLSQRVIVVPVIAPSVPKAPTTPIRATQIYLLNNKRQARDKTSVTFSAPGRLDLPSHELQTPIDWNGDPFHDRNWCAQLQMWRMLDNHFLEFDANSDVSWLELPLKFMDDWHEYHIVQKKISKFAWMDMIVGVRAMKIALVLSAHQAGKLILTEFRLRAYRTLVDSHLDFLLDIANVSYSNHTFLDMHGLAALGTVTQGKRKVEIDTFLRRVIPTLLSSQFNERGVHLENSTGYQAFGIGCLKRLKSSTWFDAFGVDRLLARANEVNAWFKMPDGRCVPIGDTDGAPMANKSECSFSASKELINDSGYVIYRDDGGGRCSEATYIFLMAAFNSRFHKQSDDLSFVWYEGEDILCDAGKFGYKASEMRGYAQSTRAHNTIEVDGKNSGDNFSRDPSLAYGSAIKHAQNTKWGFVATGQLTHANVGVRHTRHLVYGTKSWMLVVDVLESEAEHAYTQWFHFSPHLEVRHDHGTHGSTTLKSKKSLQIEAYSPSKLKTSLVKAQVKPVRQGWTSQAYGTLTPSHALGYSQTGSRALFATLLWIGDLNCNVQFKSNNLIELNINNEVDQHVFSVDLSDAVCSVVKR